MEESLGRCFFAPEVEKLFLDAPSTYWEALASNREICLFRVVPWGDAHHVFSGPSATRDGSPDLGGICAQPDFDSRADVGKGYIRGHALDGLNNKEIGDWLQSGIAFQPDPKK